MRTIDRGVFRCTQCDYTTRNIFQIVCECGGSLFLPIEENPNFHSGVDTP